MMGSAAAGRILSGGPRRAAAAMDVEKQKRMAIMKTVAILLAIFVFLSEKEKMGMGMNLYREIKYELKTKIQSATHNQITYFMQCVNLEEYKADF